jgi:hypothetical protein
VNGNNGKITEIGQVKENTSNVPALLDTVSVMSNSLGDVSSYGKVSSRVPHIAHI